jgi:hypothetical protein
MAAVGLAALDVTAVRSPLSGRPLAEALLLLGALPMANALALASLLPPGGRGGRGGGRRFLAGFEAAGAAALLLYAAAAVRCAGPLHDGLRQVLGPFRPYGNPTFLAAAVAFLLLPQLALAVLGGWVSRRYGVMTGFDDDRRRPVGGRAR